mmetsp:Transcript_22894/g.64865  ORF Transcript_22894/g.64865 Transcript_22894/m.64865 type:complete len:204 (-) Transcript_22894:249-860(-)
MSDRLPHPVVGHVLIVGRACSSSSGGTGRPESACLGGRPCHGGRCAAELWRRRLRSGASQAAASDGTASGSIVVDACRAHLDVGADGIQRVHHHVLRNASQTAGDAMVQEGRLAVPLFPLLVERIFGCVYVCVGIVDGRGGEHQRAWRRSWRRRCIVCALPLCLLRRAAAVVGLTLALILRMRVASMHGEESEDGIRQSAMMC